MGIIKRNDITYGGGGSNVNEKELTKAEYDALSEAEKNNGTTYYVKDEGGGSEVLPAVKSCKKFGRTEVRFHDVAHRGSYFAPENTIPAWILAKDIGYNAVETDVAFTSDNIPVCIHDKTIDRTSNGSGYVSEMTLEQLRQYSYDNNFTALSNKEIIFKNPDIPTFDDYILTCKTYGLHAYIHVHPFHDYTKERINSMMKIVEKYSMKDCVTWVTSIFEWLNWIKEIDPTARLGYICDNLSESDITEIKKLLSGINEVFVDFDVTAGTLTDEIVNLCQINGLPLELQVQNESNIAQSICETYPYIIGVTSNRFMISQYLAQARGGKGSFSSGTDASNPSVPITVNTDVASSGSARATRMDNMVSLKLSFTTATGPSASTRTLFTDLSVRYRPRYNQVVVAMGYFGDDVYFARLRIQGYFEGTPGAISILETNAPIGTIFETTFTYLI